MFCRLVSCHRSLCHILQGINACSTAIHFSPFSFDSLNFPSVSALSQHEACMASASITMHTMPSSSKQLSLQLLARDSSLYHVTSTSELISRSSVSSGITYSMPRNGPSSVHNGSSLITPCITSSASMYQSTPWNVKEGPYWGTRRLPTDIASLVFRINAHQSPQTAVAEQAISLGSSSPSIEKFLISTAHNVRRLFRITSTYHNEVLPLKELQCLPTKFEIASVSSAEGSTLPQPHHHSLSGSALAHQPPPSALISDSLHRVIYRHDAAQE